MQRVTSRWLCRLTVCAIVLVAVGFAWAQSTRTASRTDLFAALKARESDVDFRKGVRIIDYENKPTTVRKSNPPQNSGHDESHRVEFAGFTLSVPASTRMIDFGVNTAGAPFTCRTSSGGKDDIWTISKDDLRRPMEDPGFAAADNMLAVRVFSDYLLSHAWKDFPREMTHLKFETSAAASKPPLWMKIYLPNSRLIFQVLPSTDDLALDPWKERIRRRVNIQNIGPSLADAGFDENAIRKEIDSTFEAFAADSDEALLKQILGSNSDNLRKSGDIHLLVREAILQELGMEDLVDGGEVIRLISEGSTTYILSGGPPLRGLVPGIDKPELELRVVSYGRDHHCLWQGGILPLGHPLRAEVLRDVLPMLASVEHRDNSPGKRGDGN